MTIDDLVHHLQRVRRHTGPDAEVYIGARKPNCGAFVVGSIEVEQKFHADGSEQPFEITINPSR